MRHEPPPLLCVPPDRIDEFWPLAEPLIRSGYDAVDEFMPDDMPGWLKAGKGLLWLCVRSGHVVAAMTTSLEPKPSGLCCRMVACGGTELEYWKACEDRIVRYARDEDCASVRVTGRPGWGRALPGYKIMQVDLEKAL